MDELVTLAPLGMLGYGIPEASLERAVGEYDVDVIAQDAGSIDAGPNYLGEGKFVADEKLVRRDLRLLLRARDEEDVPLLIGTAGGSGSRTHLDRTADIVREVADEEGLEFEVARIYTDVDRNLLGDLLDEDRVRSLSYEEPIDRDDVAAAERIVAQVSYEPYVDALADGADVVLGGRSVDVGPFSAVPVAKGFDEGLAVHMAKILECGAHATVAGSGDDCLVGVLRDDHFEVEPPNPEKRCTTESVAAHTLYEKADPYLIEYPGGTVDVSDCSFDQTGPRRVRVSGSEHVETDPYSILIEGVERVGYRTIALAGVRDRRVIANVDTIAAETQRKVASMVDVPGERYTLLFRFYGDDAADGDPEGGAEGGPEGGPGDDRSGVIGGYDLGVVIEAVGDTQEIADTVCSLARSTFLHRGFEGRIATGGNLAFPYSPTDVPTGEVYRFSIYHLVDYVSPGEIAETELEVVS